MPTPGRWTGTSRRSPITSLPARTPSSSSTRPGWHDSRCLNAPGNITLLPLPSYSPELNPVENVWQYLRQNFLSNRVYDDEEILIDACCAAWNALIGLPNKITEITSREWAKTVIN